MLRTQGHAARVAAGFFGGERVGDEYVVRAGDAHAWTQVYVPGKGFVSFDATPESYRAARPQVLLAWLTQAYEAVDSFWRTRILDYSMYDQIDFARALVRPPKQRADRLPKLPPFRAWLVAFAVAGVIYGLWRWGRPWRGASAKHPASSMAAQLEKALVRAGAPLEEGEDLEARAQRWAQEQHGAASALGPAVRRYLEARFGGRPLDPEEQRRLVKPVEDALQSARR